MSKVKVYHKASHPSLQLPPVEFQEKLATEMLSQRSPIPLTTESSPAEKKSPYVVTRENAQSHNRPKQIMNLDFKNGGASLYKRDFIFHKRLKNAPSINVNNLQQYKSQQPMLLQTVNRAELVPHLNCPVPQSIKPQSQIHLTAFNGGSTYNNEFVNWGQAASMILKNPTNPTVIKDLPFAGSTYYRDNFKKFQMSEVLPIYSNKSQFKNPVSPELPFLSQTTNQYTYKPFQTKTFDHHVKQQDYTSMPSFKGQFLSTQQADFVDFRTAYLYD